MPSGLEPVSVATPGTYIMSSTECTCVEAWGSQSCPEHGTRWYTIPSRSAHGWPSCPHDSHYLYCSECNPNTISDIFDSGIDTVHTVCLPDNDEDADDDEEYDDMQDHKVCNWCEGKGKYVGLQFIEVCPECLGSGLM